MHTKNRGSSRALGFDLLVSIWVELNQMNLDRHSVCMYTRRGCWILMWSPETLGRCFNSAHCWEWIRVPGQNLIWSLTFGFYEFDCIYLQFYVQWCIHIRKEKSLHKEVYHGWRPRFGFEVCLLLELFNFLICYRNFMFLILSMGRHTWMADFFIDMKTTTYVIKLLK